MIRRLCIAAIVVICLGGPIAEMFDSWDQTSKDGNDTESNVVVLVLCAGIAFATGTIVIVNQIRTQSSARAECVSDSPLAARRMTLSLPPVPASSPPTVLRV